MTFLFDDTLHRKFLTADRLAGIGHLGGFAYNLDLSVPTLVTAIHAGHNVHEEVLPFVAISEEQRLFEEDAATEQFIEGNPSTIWSLDSRVEYDLNRQPEDALPLTPEQFWGLAAYSSNPPEAIQDRTLARYFAFYRFIGSYCKALAERFGFCVVYDIHSYNISRQVEKGFAKPPLFNLGTAFLDRSRWRPQIDAWLQLLADIRIPGHPTTVAENLVFQGKGAMCELLTKMDGRILVLPTEISKAYMDEHQGILNPEAVTEVRKGLVNAVRRHLSHLPAH